MGKIINNIVVAIISIMIFSVYANADGQANHVNGVWGSSANDVFVVGSDGMVLHSLDRNGKQYLSRLQRVWGQPLTSVPDMRIICTYI